ncbi:MAG: RNA 2',3'-cyclic phosphodiesterase [Proteobacteria bacterium]|nr:RNA 2',3'-cyclic phosphodiesterase [Pseudomonadota bacterium]
MQIATQEKDLRCFIGIFFDQQTLTSIEKAILPLYKVFSANKIRWIPLSQIHITLRFLGKTTPYQVNEVVQKLQPIAHAATPFSLSLGQIIYFPCARKPRVLALMTDFPQPFQILVNSIHQMALTMGYPETLPFISHVSLARFKTIRLPSMPVIINLNQIIHIREFALMKSETLPKGARYNTIAKFELTRR